MTKFAPEFGAAIMSRGKPILQTAEQEMDEIGALLTAMKQEVSEISALLVAFDAEFYGPEPTAIPANKE